MHLSCRFDGFTTTHRFDLHAGPDGSCDQVSYCSYSQVDKLVQTATEKGHITPLVSFGQRDPCESLFRKVKSLFYPSRSHDPTETNIGVVIRETLPSEHSTVDKKKHPRVMTVTTDHADAKHFDADTLEPLSVTSQQTIHPSLTGQMSASHASVDPTTGEVFNYNLTFGRTASYK